MREAPDRSAARSYAAPRRKARAPVWGAVSSGDRGNGQSGGFRGSFLERAKSVAGQAASTAARVGADVGRETAKVAGVAGGRAVATIRDPATKMKAQSALRKAKRGFTTALERIDPKILADVVVKATSLQERANASLRERGSVYRIGEIAIGASIPPSIQFSIVRIDDADGAGGMDSMSLLAQDADQLAAVDATETIVSLDGTAVGDGELDALVDELDA